MRNCAHKVVIGTAAAPVVRWMVSRRRIAHATVTGKSEEKGLRRAAHELSDRNGEADTDDAEPRGFVDRRNKKADRLSSDGGDQEDRGGGERQSPAKRQAHLFRAPLYAHMRLYRPPRGAVQ